MSASLPHETGCSSAAGRPVSPALELLKSAVLVVRVVRRDTGPVPVIQALFAKDPGRKTLVVLKWLLGTVVELNTPEGAGFDVTPECGRGDGGRVYAGVALYPDTDNYTLVREGENLLARVARTLEVA